MNTMIEPGTKIQFFNITGKDIERLDPDKVYTFKEQKTMFGKLYWVVDELEKAIEIKDIYKGDQKVDNER